MLLTHEHVHEKGTLLKADFQYAQWLAHTTVMLCCHQFALPGVVKPTLSLPYSARYAFALCHLWCQRVCPTKIVREDVDCCYRKPQMLAYSAQHISTRGTHFASHVIRGRQLLDISY